MSSFFNFFSRSLTYEIPQQNVKRIQDIDLTNNSITYQQNTGSFNCGVTVSCEDAETLINIMKAKKEQLTQSTTAAMTESLNKLKGNINSIDASKIQDLFNQINTLKMQYEDLKKQDAIKLKTEISDVNVPVYISVKKPNSSTKASTIQGTIKTLNLAKRTVTIEYTTSQNTVELLRDYPINKLCIGNKECKIEIGSGTVTKGTTESVPTTQPAKSELKLQTQPETQMHK